MHSLIVFCTWPAERDPLPAARTLVERGLAACVNVLPGLTSVYAWKGVVQRDSEQLLLIKTTEARYPALEQALAGLHPYELPEIVGLPIEKGLPEYLRWVTEQTAAPEE